MFQAMKFSSGAKEGLLRTISTGHFSKSQPLMHHPNTSNIFPNIKYYKVMEQVHLAIAEHEGTEGDAIMYLPGYIKIADHVTYDCFCDDFGPMNLAMVFRICVLIDEQLHCSKAYQLRSYQLVKASCLQILYSCSAHT